MAAVDPTHPLYPIASFLASVMLLLVLLTSFVRQSWNFGVALLCFWLFIENLVHGISAIVWSDNFDIKLDVYCDIGSYMLATPVPSAIQFRSRQRTVSHLQMITYIVKPMATLIITRRLHMIVSLQSVDFTDRVTVRQLSLIWSSDH